MAKGRKLGFFACFVFMAFLLLVHGSVLAEEVQADPSAETQTETVSEETVTDQTSDVQAAADETQTDTTAESETTEETQTDTATDPETTEQSKENTQTDKTDESKPIKQTTNESKIQAQEKPVLRAPGFPNFIHKENLSGYLEVHIRKTDDKGNALKGATLQITDLDNNGQPAEFWMNVQGKMVLVPNGTFVVNEDPVTIYFKRPDLDDDDVDLTKIRHFRLLELKAPDGYEEAEPLDFDLNFAEFNIFYRTGMPLRDENTSYAEFFYEEVREKLKTGSYRLYRTDWVYLIDNHFVKYTGGHIYDAAADEALLYPILMNGYKGRDSTIANKYLSASKDPDFASFLITQLAIYHKLGTISDEMILEEIQNIKDYDQDIFSNLTKEEVFAIIKELADSNTSDQSYQIVSYTQYNEKEKDKKNLFNWVGLEPIPTFCLTDHIKKDHGAVTIRKYGTDTNGKYLPGAKFQIIDADGKVVKEFVTGKEETKFILPIGTYTLHEVSAPKGYQTASDQTFEIVENKITDLYYEESDKVRLTNHYRDKNADLWQSMYRDSDLGNNLYVIQFNSNYHDFSYFDMNRSVAQADSFKLIYDLGYSYYEDGQSHTPQRITYNSADFYKAIIYILTYNYKFKGLNVFQKYYIKQSILNNISKQYFGNGIYTNSWHFMFAKDVIENEITNNEKYNDINLYIRNYTSAIIDDLNAGVLNTGVTDPYYYYVYRDIYNYGGDKESIIMVSEPIKDIDPLIEKIVDLRSTGYVKIHKYASDTHQYLAGATMQIIDQAGNVVKTFVTNGQEQTIELPFGTYTLHEVSAPQGYNVNSDVTFTVNNTGINLLTEIQKKDQVIYDENGNVVFWHKPFGTDENLIFDESGYMHLVFDPLKDKNNQSVIKVKADENTFSDQKDPKLYYEIERYLLSHFYTYEDSQDIHSQGIYRVAQLYYLMMNVFTGDNYSEDDWIYLYFAMLDDIRETVNQYSEEDAKKISQDFSTKLNNFYAFYAIYNSDDLYAGFLKANENAGELYLYYAEDGSVYVGIEPAGKTVMTLASAAITDEKIPEKPEEKKEEKKKETKKETKTVETATAHGVQTGTFTNSLMWMMLAAAAAAGIHKIHDIA
jgi:hypothetical protein